MYLLGTSTSYIFSPPVIISWLRPWARRILPKFPQTFTEKPTRNDLKKTFSCESASFFSNQSTSSAILARIFRDFAKVFTHFVQISTDFARILKEFARIFTTSKLSWCTFTPASYTTVLRGYMLFFINLACASYIAFDKCLYICDVVQ